MLTCACTCAHSSHYSGRHRVQQRPDPRDRRRAHPGAAAAAQQCAPASACCDHVAKCSCWTRLLTLAPFRLLHRRRWLLLRGVSVSRKRDGRSAAIGSLFSGPGCAALKSALLTFCARITNSGIIDTRATRQAALACSGPRASNAAGRGVAGSRQQGPRRHATRRGGAAQLAAHACSDSARRAGETAQAQLPAGASNQSRACRAGHACAREAQRRNIRGLCIDSAARARASPARR